MKILCWIIITAGLCHSVSKATECTAGGRFPNDDAECRGYTMCLFAGPSGYMQYNITCPGGFIYSHTEQQCTNATSYRCQPSYICNMTGNFENPLSQNCSSFVTCVAGINGIVTARRIECPFGNIFDPRQGCVNATDYQCSVENDNSPESAVQVQNNTDFNIQVTGENGFHLSRNVSVNSAVDVYSKSALLFVVMISVNLH